MTDFLNMNIISNYNKMLSNNMNNINDNLGNNNSISDFDNILNNKMSNFDNPLQGGISMDATDSKTGNITEGAGPDAMVNSFKNAFSSGINSLNETQLASQRAVETFATGGDIDIHEVMIAAEKSNLSMQLALQMRNKLLSAYNEIKNIM